MVFNGFFFLGCMLVGVLFYFDQVCFVFFRLGIGFFLFIFVLFSLRVGKLSLNLSKLIFVSGVGLVLVLQWVCHRVWVLGSIIILAC